MSYVTQRRYLSKDSVFIHMPCIIVGCPYPAVEDTACVMPCACKSYLHAQCLYKYKNNSEVIECICKSKANIVVTNHVASFFKRFLMFLSGPSSGDECSFLFITLHLIFWWIAPEIAYYTCILLLTIVYICCSLTMDELARKMGIGNTIGTLMFATVFVCVIGLPAVYCFDVTPENRLNYFCVQVCFTTMLSDFGLMHSSNYMTEYIGLEVCDHME